MTQTNAELCREIARLDPEWFKNLPGVAVKDPLSGLRSRWDPWDGEMQWQPCDSVMMLKWELSDEGNEAGGGTATVERALAAGPDWTDPVTVNALLGDNGMVRVTDERGGWRAWIADWDGPVVPDRVQAILLAKLASLGG